MSSGLSLRTTRRAAALLAGASLAAMSTGVAASDRALLGVSIVVEPSCAVSAPSRLVPQDLDAPRTAEMLDIDCTSGTSWSATAERQPGILFPASRPAAAGAGNDTRAAARTSGQVEGLRPALAAGTAVDPSNVIRITVRY